MDRDKEKYFNYLNDLRDSGTTNMFGAVPYLMKEFPGELDRNEARKVLTDWMESF
jgi:hypothetical protein